MTRTKIMDQPIEVNGDIGHGKSDAGNPVSMGAQGRSTNPTAVGNGERVRVMADDVGRVVNTPVQVRDLMATAYVSISGGTKTELIAGVTSTFLDLVQISFSNNSSAAATVALLDESTTVQTFLLPLNNTVIHTFPTPIPQSGAGTAWYVDMTDTSGTTVTVEALFAKNV